MMSAARACPEEREALVLEYPVGQGRLVPVLVALAEGGGLNVVDGHPGQSADVTHPAVEGCGRRVEAADPVLLIQEKDGVVQTGDTAAQSRAPGRLLRLPLPSGRRLLGGQSGPLIDEDADQPPLIKRGSTDWTIRRSSGMETARTPEVATARRKERSTAGSSRQWISMPRMELR